LFKSEGVSIPAIQKSLIDLNLEIPSNEKITSLFGDKMEEICKSLAPGSSLETRKNLTEKIRSYESLLIPEKAKLYDGVKKTLNELISSGYTLALCSNGYEDYLYLILKTLGISGLFKYIKGKHPIKNKGKVIKDILIGSDISFAIVVGDRFHDINAARENNLPSIGVTYGYGGNEALKADFIANRPEEILGQVNRCYIFARIEKEIFNSLIKGPIIIGVDGMDPSGKKEFSNLLSKYLESRGYKTALIHLDDFHNPEKNRYKGKDEIESYINKSFNLELLIEEILNPLKKGESIHKELNLFDLESNEFRKNYCIDKKTIVILEGSLLYREPINESFDYRIYLDIDFKEMVKRGKESGEFFEKKCTPIQKRYIKNHLPKGKSNIVIDNTDFDRPIVKKFTP